MENFLQTNNDLILSIHKTIVDSTQEMCRKIEALRDDVRDMKLSMSKNDRALQEEAKNWRQHTETIVKELGERHQHDVASLHKIIMELCIRSPPTQQQTIASQSQPTVPMPSAPKESQVVEQPAARKEELVAGAKKEPVVSKAIAKAEEPIGFKPPASANEPVVPQPKPTLPKATGTIWGMPPATTFAPPALPTFVPLTTAATIPSAPMNTTTTTTVSAPVVTATVTPSPVTFSFKSPGTGGLFGNQQNVPAMNGATTTTTTGGGSWFGGGAKSGTNTFAHLAAKASEASGGFLSSGTAKPTFGQSSFGGNAKDFKIFQQPSPQAYLKGSVKGADESQQGDDSDKEDKEEEFVPDAHYEPVVPLPPEIEVATGEEEEDVIFSARCKLYRYDKEAKENKERGLGDIKLLYNPKTNRHRCVMRREQVFKLCANFPIYADLRLLPREQMPTVYTWACKDFSEDTVSGTDETFSARFKDQAIAQDFYEKMTEAARKAGEQ